MQSTRNLAVALQVAPAAMRLLTTELGESAQAMLERALPEAVGALLAAESVEMPSKRHEICIYLTTDAEIREFNRVYRGVDHPTDVLSFGYVSAGDSTPTEHDPIPLGDIVISVETALRQAPPNGHSLLSELLMLALHGTLHLMGYDDSTETERATMNARAATTLRRLGYVASEEWYSRYEDE